MSSEGGDGNEKNIKSKKELWKNLTQDELKAKGNDFFKNKDMKNAILWYDRAMSEYPPTAIIYTNRAFCEFKLENYGISLDNCNSAVGLGI
jgi:tetratricopeptide (TPR) repeat protein